MIAPDYYQKWFAPDEFRRRHQHIFDRIGPGSAVVQGAAPMPGFENFRQTNEFFYLTGLEIPRAYLLLNGSSKRSVMYLPPRDAALVEKEGEELCANDAELIAHLTGVDEVHVFDRLEADLKRVAGPIYTPMAPAEGYMACQDTLRHTAKLIAADPWGNQPSREAFFVDLLKKRLGAIDVRDLSPILFAMRAVKSPAEIALMHQAGRLTAEGVVQAIRATRPGVYEYELGAIAEYVYRINGARGAGYRPIIATGKNIWLAHYYRINAQLHAGELVLMDVAPDLCNYTSDIGRLWPVNGRYSDLQRQLYGFIVEMHKALLRHLGPGILPAEVSRRAAADVEPYVNRMKFANANHERGVRKALTWPGHLTHTVGMAVHDNGTYKEEPFKPGCVFALDPQMWIPEEQIYIRVEDTVAITENGVLNTTGDAPYEIDEVEALMKSSGILQSYPPLGSTRLG